MTNGRVELAQVDVDLKADLSRTNSLLFKACSTCNASVLKQVLETHERFCHGATDRRVRTRLSVAPWQKRSWVSRTCFRTLALQVEHALNSSEFVLDRSAFRSTSTWASSTRPFVIVRTRKSEEEK